MQSHSLTWQRVTKSGILSHRPIVLYAVMYTRTAQGQYCYAYNGLYANVFSCGTIITGRLYDTCRISYSDDGVILDKGCYIQLSTRLSECLVIYAYIELCRIPREVEWHTDGLVEQLMES